ncbi:energy-coupling factor transporter transmembrane protein EcfT [Corynebacterium sp. 153RC1]|uniref:energy-coupling factor transporter transmembrane component T family protein n=1 Tax=unclassified Corynebacterium TaxID=2624378 RepID=UPI00211CD477|nr:MULTISPECIES: energy-coupling factor transporter transmembrane protein EcfT [unclassified Corynebacterium]MCQ9370768.1 energy-coupling factor transporter transmembrane protein EcfT [Corynebacterium sp. 35RC1]MCQ9351577.1 energy-coupling factor transporter transmembrane protein EcfT [Corynebacterium sp. 209RC1]MCQ9353946.1 energy-coupling factor transporter transmembrane protein EcfT [Corynebacterium sp. 1222RC1]MCQ9355860.1 energy-coupling factor transporter transmembrane protein EcfT [Coryn
MIRQVPMGVYVPGNSLIHRTPPMLKIGLLIAFIIFARGIYTPLVPIVLMAIARIPLKTAWSQVWPVLPVLAVLFAYQWWQISLVRAAEITAGILAALMLATLITLTTKLEAMMEALERFLAPTKKIGVPVDTIVLAFSLTLRLLPLMLATVGEVLDARKARGANTSLLAFGTPVVIRSMRRAQAIGDALVARGLDD